MMLVFMMLSMFYGSAVVGKRQHCRWWIDLFLWRFRVIKITFLGSHVELVYYFWDQAPCLFCLNRVHRVFEQIGTNGLFLIITNIQKVNFKWLLLLKNELITFLYPWFLCTKRVLSWLKVVCLHDVEIPILCGCRIIHDSAWPKGKKTVLIQMNWWNQYIAQLSFTWTCTAPSDAV